MWGRGRPAKTAVMLFAPGKADPPLQDGAVVWGAAPVLAVQSYKFLGVMLAADCRWGAHASYIIANATRPCGVWPRGCTAESQNVHSCT